MSTKHSGFPLQFHEVWNWSVAYYDGSQPRHGFDWGTSRRCVMEEVGWNKLGVCGDINKWSRFKRRK